MIKFDELTIPYLKGEISYTQWIDNIYETFCEAIKESICEMSII
jgi:hypothetical protein